MATAKKSRKWTEKKVLSILKQYDKLTKRGAKSAFLNRKGITTGHINYFRRRYGKKLEGTKTAR